MSATHKRAATKGGQAEKASDPFLPRLPKRGVLLVNLGSPDSPSVSDVRRYLREFLMDPRVIDVPYPIRFAIVHGFILPFRPRKSAEAYAKIWTQRGSPLVSISHSLQRRLHDRTGLPVEVGMRYQKPAIESALSKLIAAGVGEVLVAPLFPHHADSSYGSAVEHVKQVARKVAPELKLAVLPPYYDHPEYIRALVASAQPYLTHDLAHDLAHGYDHVVLSFHGLPQRHVKKANPECGHCLGGPDCGGTGASSRVCYRRHCLATVNAFVAALPPNAGAKVSFAFQSRLGADAWLEPSTHNEILRLASAGVRKLAVMCPAFTVDCLETLEEIGIRAKEAFLQAGGREFTLIPCLNDHPAWVDGLAKMVLDPMAWPDSKPAVPQAGLSRPAETRPGLR
jgi:protoporphyrin/coproporphyrin ferrochelatase